MLRMTAEELEKQLPHGAEVGGVQGAQFKRFRRGVHDVVEAIDQAADRRFTTHQFVWSRFRYCFY